MKYCIYPQRWVVVALASTFLTGVFHFLTISPPHRVALADDEVQALFYASFDKNVLADHANGDETPLANRALKFVREGRKGGALFLDTESQLTYNAPGNLQGEAGTLGFWWRLEEPLGRTPFSIVRISQAQAANPDYSFAHLLWTGEDLRLRVYDRDGTIHEIVSASKTELVSGRWFHLAFSWDELDGIVLYVDGQESGKKAGELHLPHSLDQLGIHAKTVTPLETKGNERKVFVDELRVYGRALEGRTLQDLSNLGGGRAGSIPSSVTLNPELWNLHWRKRFSWLEASSVPRLASPVLLRRVPILEGRDAGRRDGKASDGKPETGWPLNETESSERKLQCRLSGEPFDLMQFQGSFRGSLSTGRGALLKRVDAQIVVNGVVSHELSPTTDENLLIERESGVLREIALFSRSGLNEKLGRVPAASRLAFRLLPAGDALNLQGLSRNQIATLYNVKTQLQRRYQIADQAAWVAIPPGLLPDSLAPDPKTTKTFHYCHVIIPPFLRHTALDAIRLKFKAPTAGRADPMIHISIKDPVSAGRELLSANFQLGVSTAPDVVFDFPDVVAPAGAALWMTVASDQTDFGPTFLTGAEVELWLSQTEGASAGQARKEYLADRLPWLRENFRDASQTSPWTNGDIAQMRRQAKTLDELLAVVEDVLRVDPKEPTALTYQGWIKPKTIPPDFKQPTQPAEVPLWAFQQQFLVEQIRQMSEWWIRNRQSKSGDFDDSLSQDTQLVMNWPGAALMEGPGSALRDSLVSVLTACERRGLLKRGFGSVLSEPEDVYYQGMALLPAALLMQHGNPLWVERLMEAARHLERISGTNQAGHRHFRSYLLSASDLVEEGQFAREDVHSALLWQPALALAWYNRHPQATRWIREAADALLVHWQQDRFPNKLTLGVRFFSDEAARRGWPDPEQLNLLWGAFRLTGDNKYLWLVNELVNAENLALAESTGGRWLDFLDVEPYQENFLESRKKILEWVRERNIWDHNLQNDESGLLARQHAFELTGDKKYIEDYQAALLKHLAQNRMMYTEAEPFTSQVRMPHMTLQRSRLGGVAFYREAIYPGHAVSWEGASSQLASLVLKADGKSIKLVVFNFVKTLLDVTLRVWDLENGTYSVIEGTDVVGNDRIDVETTRRSLLLRPGAEIPLSLRPLKTTVIEISQTRKGALLEELSDLAVEAGDLQYERGADHGSLVIHNLGVANAPSFTVQVENEKRTVLFKKQVDGLEAPLDLLPRRITVEFSGLRLGASRALVFRIDPEGKVDEVSEENNAVRTNLN